MQYITGIHALNLTCNLDTYGDWHQSAIQWKNPNTAESDNMFFKEWGIEPNHKIPEHDELFYVANHIRALLDLLEMGNYAIPQGMKEDFICNDKYDILVFQKITAMKSLPNWQEIDAFITKEYKTKWLEYKRKNKIEPRKIEMLYHEKENEPEEYTIDQIDQIAIRKELDYMGRDKIRDLYDIVFICNNYWDELSKPVKSMIQHGFEQKGLEHFDYLIQTQKDELIDNDKLAEDLLNIFDKLGIIDEKQSDYNRPLPHIDNKNTNKQDTPDYPK